MIEIKFEKNSNKSVAYDQKQKMGECVFIETENCWNIIHTEVDNSYQGQGIARRLVENIIENAKIYNKTVIADCSYAKNVLEKSTKKEIDFLNEFNNNVFFEENTIFEKAGFPHQEVVHNNLLAFYLNVNGEHKLKDTILKSLLESANIKITNEINDIKVEKANYYRTEGGNYMDIVLHNNEFSVVIENKLFAKVNNPFKDYSNTMEHRFYNPYKIFLYIETEEEKLEEAKKYGFILVKYDTFIKNIKLLTRDKWDNSNKWHIILKDMIETIEHINAENKISEQTYNWIENNSNKIIALNNNIAKLSQYIEDGDDEKFNYTIYLLNKYMQKEAEQIHQYFKANINNSICKIRPIHNVKVYLNKLIIYDIKTPKMIVAVDNVIQVNGYCINISLARYSKSGKLEEYRNLLIKKLNDNGIKIVEEPNNFYVDVEHITVFESDKNITKEELLQKNIEIINTFSQE